MDNLFSSVKSFSLGKTLRTCSIALAVGFAANVWAAPEAAKPAPTKPAVEKPIGVININTADAAALAELNGIGDAKAAAIVDYRKQHGPFKSVEQLADVKGIGDKFIEKNRNRLSVR